MIRVIDARRCSHLAPAAAPNVPPPAPEAAGKLIGSVLYNVGHRRWLRRGPAPRPGTGPPDRLGQPGPFPGLVDGHEATELHPANNVSVTADPS